MEDFSTIFFVCFITISFMVLAKTINKGSVIFSFKPLGISFEIKKE